jgi:hypothetical protein
LIPARAGGPSSPPHGGPFPGAKSPEVGAGLLPRAVDAIVEQEVARVEIAEFPGAGLDVPHLELPRHRRVGCRPFD